MDVIGESVRPVGQRHPETEVDAIAATPTRRRPGIAQMMVGTGLLAPFMVLALLAPQVAPMDPNTVDLINRLAPPSWQEGGTGAHILGTDHLGRDILSRIIHGARVSMVVGLLATIGAGTIGVFLGLLSGFYRKGLGSVIMGFAEVQQSFPFLALAIVVVAVLGRGLTNLVIVLIIGGWILFALVVRGETMSLSEREYIEAARVLGASDFRVMFRHILPNILSSVIIVASFSFAWFIIAEASLSFLGLGGDPSVPSWGQMMSDSRNYLAIAWWYPTFPGVSLVACVLGANLLGDGLQDFFDPWQI